MITRIREKKVDKTFDTNTDLLTKLVGSKKPYLPLQNRCTIGHERVYVIAKPETINIYFNYIMSNLNLWA